jgi:hypothetical protein
MTVRSEDQVCGKYATVYGTVESGDYVIRVNGVLAENVDGWWTAENVPVTPGGVASFTVAAYPSGQDGNDAVALMANATVEKRMRLYMATHVTIRPAVLHPLGLLPVGKWSIVQHVATRRLF